MTLKIGKGFSSVRHLSASNCLVSCSSKIQWKLRLYFPSAYVGGCRGPATAICASCTTSPHDFCSASGSHTDEGQFVTCPPTLTQNKVIKADLSADGKPAGIFSSAYQLVWETRTLAMSFHLDLVLRQLLEVYNFHMVDNCHIPSCFPRWRNTLVTPNHSTECCNVLVITFRLRCNR